MSQAAATAAKKLDPAVDLLAEVGTVREVTVQDKGDRGVDVVIRVHLERPASRRKAAGS